MNTRGRTSKQRGPRPPTEKQLSRLISHFEEHQDQFELFRRQVFDFFAAQKRFVSGHLPLVHSVKSRLKDPTHLREKIRRKWQDGPITVDTLFSRITDLAGVRVIHLYSQQFPIIHRAIQQHIQNGAWTLHEPPVAYSWDPEASRFFERLGLVAQQRDSYYTSIHYVVKPQISSELCCEIQVRTLFEEAWGEIDHALNYPQKTDLLPCREQLRVLAKLASTGTRLADSIFAAAEDMGTSFLSSE